VVAGAGVSTGAIGHQVHGPVRIAGSCERRSSRRSASASRSWFSSPPRAST